ncbi:3c4bbe02-ad65-48cc-8e6c-8c885a7ad15e [Thermothielavioides terrestris]|uniref:3c4bbe02-ad65-48cc-8e6c-8c885a7ad15e n=1 Tax=Thermothielavioides terrestris TaxID=2587410 RepID=A0A3S4F2C5_9PEZI|nr:3c4bbe02-ad65-48cc-8e6c-8c885a7ad15e [Thermothielavioides terrestris]
MTENIKPASSQSKTRGVVNFPPFEALDESSLREVRRFQVHPFGSIQETCERIPYNSGKKDFFSKTGREGFEVFHYDFKIPGDDTPYTVMWDYNVGLTTPAKMLNQNPGLKDITHSITGGSIKAQGYWMPFSCAKAVCATFCYSIAGALIPLFGPQFPFECIPEKAAGHGRMTINPDIVARARSEAAAALRPPAALPSPRASRSVSPLPSHRSAHIPEPYNHPFEYERPVMLSPYTDTDVDYRPPSELYDRRIYRSVPPLRVPVTNPPAAPAAAPAPTPQHSPAWTAVNEQTRPLVHHACHQRAISNLHGEPLGTDMSVVANPWLSAVPRSPATSSSKLPPCSPRPPPYPHQHHHYLPLPASSPFHEQRIVLPPLHLKRRFDEVDILDDSSGSYNRFSRLPTNPSDRDEAYDADGSHAGTSSPGSASAAPISDRPTTAHGGAEAEHDITASNTPAPPPTPATDAVPFAPAPPSPSRRASDFASGPGCPTAESMPVLLAQRPDTINAPVNSSSDSCSGGGGSSNNNNQPPRPAVERDAALTLMRLLAAVQRPDSSSNDYNDCNDTAIDSGNSDGNGDSNGNTNNTNNTSNTGNTSISRANADEAGAVARSASSGGSGAADHQRPTGAAGDRSSPRRRPGRTKEEEEGGSGGAAAAGASAGAGATSRQAMPTPPPPRLAASVEGQDTVAGAVAAGGGGGPNTRAKRRRMAGC